jgi:hypothetical protein
VNALWRVSLRVPRADAEELRVAFVDLAPQGFEERDVDGVLELVVYAGEDDVDALRAQLPGAAAEPVAEGWEDSWRTFHRPVEVAGLWIGPPWEHPPTSTPS